MALAPSQLIGLGPVCLTDEKSGAHWRTPNPSLYSNIPLLRQFLNLIENDWLREVMPYQVSIANSSTEGEKTYHLGTALVQLQPHYLKCLFSYVMFFVALEHAYDVFYREVNALNRKPFLQVTHDKRPKPNQYIKKVKLIRNISIAHIESDKAKMIDAEAGMMWQPMTLSKGTNDDWDVNTMTFAGGRLTTRDSAGNILEQSTDMEIQGIPELHTKCSNYVDEYDRFCAEYLARIIDKLPITVDSIRYFDFKEIPTLTNMGT